MEKRKSVKISLYTLLVVLSLGIILLIMIILMYKPYNKRTTEFEKAKELQAQSNALNEAINSSQSQINNNLVTINLDDYIGIWYENENSVDLSEICLAYNEKGELIAEIGIFRLTTFDTIKLSQSNNIISFYDQYGTRGTMTLGDNKIILNYSTDLHGITNELIEFNYKKHRTSTEVLSGYDISGTWTLSNSSDYIGYITLNTDNTFVQEVTSGLMKINNEGTFKIYGNKIIFTASNGKTIEGEYNSGHINYIIDSETLLEFYP